MKSMRWMAICAMGAIAGCPAPEDGDDGDDAATTSPPTASTTNPGTTNPDPTATTSATGSTGGSSDAGTTGGSTTSAEDDASSGNVDPPKFDTPPLPDAPPVDTTCTMVDFLFVIDNSGSMSSSQMNLVANFPAFINGIQGSLENVDSYHVGVVSTDTHNPNPPNCQNLSSLVVNSSGGACGPYAEGNYMTEADDLAATFPCAGNLGTSGSGLELTMQAAVEAVQNIDGDDPGECNEGFLRDDSLLVIVIITDEYDGPGDPEGTTSPGTPMEWFDDVVAARQGIPENIVVLSLINYAGGPCPPLSMVYDGINIQDFTMMFGDNGFLGGICEPDYGPIFNDAIAVIDTACENFMPPQG